MALSDLTSPTAIKRSMEECDRLGREQFLRQYGFADAREYVLHHEGKCYDSKAIAGVAHGFQNPLLGVLKASEFSGGISSSSAGLRVFDLGFVVEGKRRNPKDWSLHECEIAVRTYFDCLRSKLRNEKYNRSAACQSVASEIGRKRGAVDYKFQNIDAILFENQLPRLNNAVASNVQRLLRYVVLDPLARHIDVFSATPSMIQTPPHPDHVFVPIPEILLRTKVAEKSRSRNIVTDFALIDANNRNLGKMGEKWVVELERYRLRCAGHGKLAEQVRWVSQLDGDGCGYDIESFEDDGKGFFIEVKTTNAGALVPFFISPNELAVADRMKSAYRLYRVFNYSHNPQIFVIQGPLTNKLRLQAQIFSALPVQAL